MILNDNEHASESHKCHTHHELLEESALRKTALALTLVIALLLTACAGGKAPAESPATQNPPSSDAPPAASEPTGPVVVYSGRNENLVGPLLEAFTASTGIEVEVKYGSTSELAATLLEEGSRSPADLFFSQDGGALGALSHAGMLAKLPDELLNQVDSRFRAKNGEWVGTSARARVVAYNTERVNPSDLPDSIWGYTEPEWKGRIGWVPGNASFHTFVTALRKLEGDERALEWLRAIQANEPRVYQSNGVALSGTAAGEVDVAFVNHYYLFRYLKEHGESFTARNHYMSGDAGALVNVAGVAVLKTASNAQGALKLAEWLLSEEAQTMVVQENGEYPLHPNVPPPFDMPPLAELNVPDIDLSELEDLEGTLQLLHEAGIF